MELPRHLSSKTYLANQSIIKVGHYGYADMESRLKNLKRRYVGGLDLQVIERREVSGEAKALGKIVRSPACFLILMYIRRDYSRHYFKH